MMFKGIKQHDERDCGAACLSTICMQFNLKMPLVNIRELMHVDKNGSSIYAITETAEEFNLTATALKGDWHELTDSIDKQEVKLPFIAHIIKDGILEHYIIVYKITGSNVHVFDPAKGRTTYGINAFKEVWTGYVISFEKKANFKPGNKKRGVYKKFLKIITEQKRLFLIVIFFSLVLAVVSIIASLAYQRLIDGFLLNNTSTNGTDGIPVISNAMEYLYAELPNINYLFIALILIYVFRFILELTRGLFLSLISKKSSELLMYSFTEHILELPVSFFHDRKTGEILSRFNDIEEIRDIVSGVTLSLVLDSFMLIAGAFVLISINIELFFLVLCLAVFYAFIVLLYRKPLANINRDIMENDAQVTSVLKEVIDGIEVYKTCSNVNNKGKNINEQITKYIRNIFKGNIIGISQTGFLSIVDGVGITIILWVGSLFVMSNMLSLGSLIAFTTLVSVFITPVQNLIELQPTIQKALISAERLNDVLEIKKESDLFVRSDDAKSLYGSSISCKDVTFSYGYRQPVLSGINLDIPSGDRVVIVGDNGSGKTTLLHLLASFYSPQKGEIRIGGHNIQEISLGVLRSKVAYVPQNTMLFSGSLTDNIVMGSNSYTEDELNKIVKGCCIDEIIKDNPFGLESVISENGKDLSGGQRQRLAIARALLSKPEVLLLDESTSNLDRATEKHIIEFIREEFPKLTSVSVSHKLSQLKDADQIIYLSKGRVVSVGDYKQQTGTLKFREFLGGDFK